MASWCGSQVFLCDLPVRFDTYQGCTHRCTYCFAAKKVLGFGDVRKGNGVVALRKFVAGSRTLETAWCDWNIPLHWGGVSDPFQPAEAEYRYSRQCLEVFAESGHPFAVSTKGRLAVDPEYLALFKDCNAAIQVSLVSPQYDRYEPGAPPFAERLAMLPKLAAVSKRLIVRSQPYSVGLLDDILQAIPKYRDAGVWGISVEGMKRSRKKEGFVRIGGDFAYPTDVLRRDYTAIKQAAHENGLAFLCAENRLRREMSDDLCCCGVGGLEGFRPNIANLNHEDAEGNIPYTERMEMPKTGECFRTLVQNQVLGSEVRMWSYKRAMEVVKRSKNFRNVMGM